MNSWNFTGNLGADAEQRVTPSGEPVVSFSVGVKAGFGDRATTTWAHETLRKRTTFKNRRSPILDPITAAMLGYTRRGTGWVKNQNRSS